MINKHSLCNYRPQREGNVFTGIFLFTIGLMATDSLLNLVTVRSVRILKCFLVQLNLSANVILNIVIFVSS